MSKHIPLYRKYRPQSFGDLVGQEALTKALKNAIELNKIAHAYLLCGPRGTGKTSSARILAKSLNCEKGSTITPCGVCPSCVDVTASRGIDVIEIDAASNGRVEDARDLLEKVVFAPVSSRYKIYIIDEVHMLTVAAFNTLLKTLEEPPNNLIFILATTEPHKVLNTIISRCQRFDFRRIKQADIVARLEFIAEKEAIKISPKALQIIARKASGALRDAVGLLDQASILALDGKEVCEDDILMLLGNISEDVLIKIGEIIATNDTAKVLPVLNELFSIGCEPSQILKDLIFYFRNLAIVKSSNSFSEIEAIVDISDQSFPVMKTQGEKFEMQEIIAIIEKLSENEYVIKNSSQQYLWLEVILIGICHRSEIASLKTLEARVLKLEEESDKIVNVPFYTMEEATAKLKGVNPFQKELDKNTQLNQTKQPTQEPKKAQTSPVETKPTKTHLSTNINDDWTTLLSKIASVPSRAFFKSLAKPIEINCEKIIISMKNDSLAKQAKESGKLKSLEEAAELIFGTIPRVSISDKKEAPKPQPEQLKQDVDDMEALEEPKKKIVKPPTEDKKIEISPKRAEHFQQSDNMTLIMDVFDGKVID